MRLQIGAKLAGETERAYLSCVAKYGRYGSIINIVFFQRIGVRFPSRGLMPRAPGAYSLVCAGLAPTLAGFDSALAWGVSPVSPVNTMGAGWRADGLCAARGRSHFLLN